MSHAAHPNDAHVAAHGAHAGHGDAAQHGHPHHHDEAGHGTFKGYMTGFVLSVVLTAIPFILVMGEVFSSSRVTGFLIMAFAAVQIVVHMIYFLHMNTKSEGGWNMLALIFTVVIVVIMLAGSLWVMYHLNTNMMSGVMSGMPPQAGEMP